MLTGTTDRRGVGEGILAETEVYSSTQQKCPSYSANWAQNKTTVQPEVPEGLLPRPPIEIERNRSPTERNRSPFLRIDGEGSSEPSEGLKPPPKAA
jgi:uncharacterized protein YbbK (DUF523 family)